MEKVEKTVDEAVQRFASDLVENNRKFLTGMEHLISMRDVVVNATPKDEIYREDRMRVYHYPSPHKKTCPVPVLICYALVNRYYMMDLQSDRSLIQNMLKGGLDLYIIDWGYPSKMDRYLTLDDYINGYLGSAVDAVRRQTGHDKINLLGVCQGGTFSSIYTSLHQEKIRNLVTMVTPIDFHVDDGLLNIWAQDINVDNLVDTYGVVPGSFMNYGFLMLKPFQLMLDKYVAMLDIMDNRNALSNFVRMEKWIFDSPGQAGEAFRQFIKDMYQGNKLIKGDLEIDGKRVNLKNITCPLLNIYGDKDHLVPPTSSEPLTRLVSSTDTVKFNLPIGHIGMYVSSKSQKEIAPRICTFLENRSGEARAAKPKAATKKATAKKAAPKKTAAKKAAPKKTTKKKKATAKKTSARKAPARTTFKAPPGP